MISHVIQGKVESPKKINLYELEVNSMSGDADAYHTDSVCREHFDELTYIIRILDSVKQDPYLRVDKVMDFVEDRAKEIYVEYGIPKEEQDLSDFYWDLVGNNVCWEGYPAQLQGFKVFHYDFEGVKRYVDVYDGTRKIC